MVNFQTHLLFSFPRTITNAVEEKKSKDRRILNLLSLSTY